MPDNEYKRFMGLAPLKVWYETNQALDNFYQKPEVNLTNDKDPQTLEIKNSMRHIVGPAFLSQKYGANNARIAGYIKEFLDGITHPNPEDTLIDLKNNDIGIDIGRKYPHINRDSIIEYAYKHVLKQLKNK